LLLLFVEKVISHIFPHGELSVFRQDEHQIVLVHSPTIRTRSTGDPSFMFFFLSREAPVL